MTEGAAGRTRGEWRGSGGGGLSFCHARRLLSGIQHLFLFICLAWSHLVLTRMLLPVVNPA